MKITNFFKKYLKPDIIPLNKIEISQSAIIHHDRLRKQIQPSYQIIPVLKGNAYGHGLRAICQILNTIQSEIQMVAVDSFPEYQIVRDQTSCAILMLNETNHHNYRYFDFSRTSFVVYTLETVKFLGSLGEQIHIHIFFNTGINREGFQIWQIDQLATILKQYPNLQIQWVMSHLSSSQSSDQTTNQHQLDLYKQMLAKLKTQVVCNPQYIHISNTCGMATIDDPLLTAGRVWLGLYGYTWFDTDHPSYTKIDWLQPALSLISMITALQECVPGDTVGYDQTYQISQHSKIALLPLWYYEWLKRSAWSHRSCLVKWVMAPVRGLISMNLTSIDVTGMQVTRHDPVTIISRDPNQSNTIPALALASGCSIYEVLVWLDVSIRRVVVA